MRKVTEKLKNKDKKRKRETRRIKEKGRRQKHNKSYGAELPLRSQQFLS